MARTREVGRAARHGGGPTSARSPARPRPSWARPRARRLSPKAGSGSAFHAAAARPAATVVGATLAAVVGFGAWMGPAASSWLAVLARGAVVAALLAALLTTRSRLTGARREAETDALTGVGNRRLLERALERLPVGGAVIVVDLDHFKRFNDRYGHLAGDGVLRAFAHILTTCVRGADAVCRFGGEEFVLVIDDPADAGDLFLRIRSAWEEGRPAVTFSAGLATRRPGEDPSAVLRRADSSLYEAKSGGRDRQAGTVAGGHTA